MISTIRCALLAGFVLTVTACTETPEPTAPASGDAPHALIQASLFQLWSAAVSIDPGGFGNINTPALEGCPAESRDGRALFFASDRPGGHGGLDIWVARRNGRNGPWKEPENLPAPVNSGADDFCPTTLPDGGLLFVSRRPGGCGAGTSDIYLARYHPQRGWLEPEHFGCDVNSTGNEFSPSYVAAGRPTLYFSSDRAGLDNIYRTVRRPDGSWGIPEPVAELNFPGSGTARPSVSHDGRTIIFDSTRPGGFGGPDIWVSTRTNVSRPWSEPANAGSNVNSPFADVRPVLSTDGKRLYFGSNRPGHVGAVPNLDLYVVHARGGP